MWSAKTPGSRTFAETKNAANPSMTSKMNGMLISDSLNLKI